jgi:hypothetical protein
MKYLNIDVTGGVFAYDSGEAAVSMSHRLPYQWKAIALAVHCCNSCGRVLDNGADPLSTNCGGDCMQCMADAGDPDCISAVRKLGKPT